MNSRSSQSNGALSGRNSLRPTHFFCNAPKAQMVRLAGDFNHWAGVPMQRRVDGWWHIELLLCHGHHHYRFVVDGKPELDPAATGTGCDEHGAKTSLVAVS